MNNKQIERIISMYIGTAKVFGAILISLALLIGYIATAEASPAAPKNGVCEVLVVEDGQTIVTEVGPC